MKIDRDAERETRIHLEVVADAHDKEERAMGWCYYLDDRLRTPFRARCITPRTKSPLHESDIVTVTGVAPEDDCLQEMFVTVQWQDRTLDVPLGQLAGVDVDANTAEAIADWHYWLARGYEL